MSVDTQTVLITGALTGIGRETAVAFAETGANVVISGRRPEAGQALAEQLVARGGEAVFIAADVRYEAEVRSLVDGAVSRYGRLDVAVNNAGVDAEMVPFAEITPDSYAATFDTNVLGTVLSIKHELRVMKPQESGSIVNLTSIYGQKGFPVGSLYVASKHAIIGLTRSAALEAAGSGVRVNAIAPGPVQTAMLDRVTGDADTKAAFLAGVPQGRAGEPREVADALKKRGLWKEGETGGGGRTASRTGNAQ